MDRSFDQDALEAIVHLLGNKVDLRAFDLLSTAVDDLHWQAGTNIGCPLRGNINVSFQLRVLVNCGEQRLRRNIVSNVNGNIANDSCEWGSQMVIGELALLRNARGLR